MRRNTRDQFNVSTDLRSPVLEAVLAKFAERMQTEGVTQQRINTAVEETLYLAVGAATSSA